MKKLALAFTTVTAAIMGRVVLLMVDCPVYHGTHCCVPPGVAKNEQNSRSRLLLSVRNFSRGLAMRTMNEHSDTKLYNGATGAPKHVCKLQLSSTMDNGIQYISKKEHISEEHLMKLLTKEVQLRCAEVDDMINKGKAALKKNFPSAKTNEVNAALNAQSLFRVENLSVARIKLRIILRS